MDKEKKALYMKAWRLKNKEWLQEYGREYKKKYSSSDHGKKIIQEYNKKYHDDNFETEYPKHIARKRTRYLVINGTIKKEMKCSMCGKDGKTDLHHKDYNNISDVIELCRGCHQEIHRNSKQQPKSS